MLADQDRIFTNIYGWESFGLDAARNRGENTMTEKLAAELLDASNNTAMEPYRAFIGDRLPSKQLAKGFLAQSLFIGAGSALAAITRTVVAGDVAGWLLALAVTDDAAAAPSPRDAPGPRSGAATTLLGREAPGRHHDALHGSGQPPVGTPERHTP